MNVTLLHALGRVWWLVLLRGLAAIAFGIVAWTWPGLTLINLTLLWGAFALVDGIASLWSAWQGRNGTKPLGHVVLIGILGVVAGLVTLFSPGLTTIALATLIGVWAILNGAIQIYTAIKLRKEIPNEWQMILSGALSLLFGILMVARPGAGALALLWAIAAFAIFYGVLIVFFAFRLKKLGARLAARHAGPATPAV